MKAKICEIFSSLQGEGKYLGEKQTFVRFYECNMHCVWCDTPYSIGDVPGRFSEMTLKDILAEVMKLSEGCHSVSLTGGEPLMHKDFLKNFLPFLKDLHLKTYLETNGTLPNELSDVISDIDIVAMDIKLPSSTKCQSYWKEHEDFLKIALVKDVFIKTVVSSGTSKEDIVQAAALVAKVDPSILFILQPNFFDLKTGIMDTCMEFQKMCSGLLKDVRVIPQVHKFLKLR